MKLTETIRPDLFTAIRRKVAFRAGLLQSPVGSIDPRNLNKAPIRHETLPDSLIWRLRLIRAALYTVDKSTIDEWVDNFRRDSHPTKEVEIWECAVTVFLEITHEERLENRYHRDLYRLIFTWISGANREAILKQSANLPKEVAQRALSAMRQHHISGADAKEFEAVSAARKDILDIENFEGDAAQISDHLLEVLAKREVRSKLE